MEFPKIFVGLWLFLCRPLSFVVTTTMNNNWIHEKKRYCCRWRRIFGITAWEQANHGSKREREVTECMKETMQIQRVSKIRRVAELAGFSNTMQSRKVIRCMHEAREVCECVCVCSFLFFSKFDTMFCVLFSAFFVCVIVQCALSLSLVAVSYHTMFIVVSVPVLWTNCQCICWIE